MNPWTDDDGGYDAWLNDLMGAAPESWDGDDAAESIVTAYVHELERRLLAAGGSLERWPGTYLNGAAPKVGDKVLLPPRLRGLPGLEVGTAPGQVASVDEGWVMVDCGPWGQFGCSAAELTPTAATAARQQLDAAISAALPESGGRIRELLTALHRELLITLRRDLSHPHQVRNPA